MSSLLIILILISLTSQEIKIIGPKELASSLKPTLELEYANFGNIPSNFISRGEIIIDSENFSKDACESFPDNFIYNNPKFKSDFPIILVKRGGCSFVSKARNSQNAGAGMLIIINNNNEDIHKLIMSDDGTGGDIYIPVAMISLNDGTFIMDYLLNNPWKKITTEVSFGYYEIEEIQLEFFFSSHEEKAYPLIKTISEYYTDFNGKIKFIPRYVTHQSPYYNQKNPKNIENCFSKGKYCYFPKSGSIASSVNVLLENLRQKCVFIFHKDSIHYYFDYMNNFYSECYENREFNIKCSSYVLNKIGIEEDEIEDCIYQSFGIKNQYGKIDYDKENKLFEIDYSLQIDYGLNSFPAITINTIPLEGIIKEEKLIYELCNKIEEKPEFCTFFLEHNKFNSLGIGAKIFIVFLIIFFVLIVIALYFFCRNYINLRVHQRVYTEEIDIDGRINNAISNYFKLKESQKK